MRTREDGSLWSFENCDGCFAGGKDAKHGALFTAPVAGVYSAEASIKQEGMCCNGYWRVGIAKNGNKLANIEAGLEAGMFSAKSERQNSGILSVSGGIYMAKGDTAGVYVYTSHTGRTKGPSSADPFRIKGGGFSMVLMHEV